MDLHLKTGEDHHPEGYKWSQDGKVEANKDIFPPFTNIPKLGPVYYPWWGFEIDKWKLFCAIPSCSARYPQESWFQPKLCMP